MIRKNPRLGCTKRAVGCHGSCPEYEKAKAEHDAEKARIQAVRGEERVLDLMKKQGIAKVKRATRNR